MACKDLPFRSAEANAKDYLRKRGIIDKFLNILDLNKFRLTNASLREHGKTAYKIDGQWFYEDLGGTKAVPNKKLFKQVDDMNGVYYSELPDGIPSAGPQEIFDDIFDYKDGEHENSEVIDNLLKNGYIPYHMKELAETLRNKPGKTLVVNQFEANDSDAYMLYRGATNQIEVPLEAMRNSEYFGKAYLHEVLHHYTLQSLVNPVSDNQKSFARNMNRLYESAVALYKGDKSAHYGLKNVVEFVSEIMTNEKFVNDLKTKKPTMWQKIINFISRLLSGNQIHEKAVSDIMNYVNSVNASKEQTGNQSLANAAVAHSPKPKESKKRERSTSTEGIPDEYKPQYAYYKKAVIKAKNDLAKKKKELLTATKADGPRIKAEMAAIEKFIKETNTALDELKESGNIQILINMAKQTIAKIDHFIDNANDKDIEDVKDNNINRFRTALLIFKEFDPVVTEATAAYKKLKPLIKRYAMAQVKHAIGRELTKEEETEITKDIFVGEKNLGTLSSVKDYLGKSIGIMIKKAQAEVTRKNTEAYEELAPLVKGVSDWASKNGIEPKNTYKVFIQEAGGTTVLTKPYTTEFYDRINETYDKTKHTEKEGKKLRKEFAKWNPLTKEHEPTNNAYVNKNYTTIQENDELRAFYDYFKKKISEISDELPISLTKNFIPNVVEESLMDIIGSDKTLMEKAKGAIEHITDMYDVTDANDEHAVLFDEKTFPDEIPLRYIAKVGPENKTTDLGDALLKFIQFGNSYKEMSEVLPKARLLQEEIANRSYIKNTNSKIKIDGENTNIFHMAKTFIDMQVRGIMKHDEKLEKLNYGKIIDFGLKYTSLLRIGLNPFNAVTNVGIGGVGNYIEAIGGRYFNVGEYNRAIKIFSSQTLKEDSKVNKLIKLFNPLMELEDYENLEKIGIAYLSSQKFQEKVKSFMYLPQKAGEKFLQTTTMIANLMHDKIEDKDGNEISLWEAFDENGEWQTEKMGKPLDDDMIFKITSKVQRINSSIHGRYSQKDSAILNQYSLFRMVFQFKKWIPAAFESRFQSKRFDDTLGHEIEGRYRTYFKGLEYMYMKLKGDVEGMKSKKFTETDIYNMRKNVMELTVIMALTLLGLTLKEAGDDDDELKKNGFYKYSMLQLDRVAQDMLLFYKPLEVNKQLSNGIPLTKSINDLGRVLYNMPHILGEDKDDIFQRGFRKGENKFLASFLDIIPGVKQGVDVYRTSKDISYEEANRR